MTEPAKKKKLSNRKGGISGRKVDQILRAMRDAMKGGARGVDARDDIEWVADFDCSSWAQFSLKYILPHPAITCVLTETSNPAHMVENALAAYGRMPDAAERNRMKVTIDQV